MSGPLAGVRVLDLTSVAMGPYATQILGDMGADVIKIEARQGDVFRHVSPCANEGMGAAFLNLNRNKRSVVLDLKTPEGHGALLELVQNADVLVFNVRPQSMRKLGLDYATLAALNPRLIYCGAYGFSEAGPYAGRPAFDDIVQAMSGAASLQGHGSADGPAYMNTILADKVAGLTIAYSVSMALYERERSGQGQSIEVPMFETVVSFLLTEHLAGKTFRPARGDTGYDRVLSPHRRPYRTKDGYLGLLPYTDAQWRRFFEVAGCAGYADDPRFAKTAARSRHIDALYEIVNNVIASRGTDEWMSLLGDADLPVTRVVSPDELLDDPHLQAIGFFRDDAHPTEGAITTMSIPVTFSRTPGDVRRLAPNLGEHTEEVLGEHTAAKSG
ncbi:CaiB/BaiF CoA transferase family protein [Paraburkholderia sp. BCC1886]|uniref:CaiB/BaiF CoA transferase family protein n=1 Tax=Paraburkholderia sp. BCC1886 TaxID=2562670 RepID=UPI00118318A9|nr:CoA transferase [Paraburkholderia sp. BCC1886]